MNNFLGALTTNAAALVTLITAAVLLIKTSGRFSKWASTKIVKAADLDAIGGHLGKCKYEQSLTAMLTKLDKLDALILTTKRLEYLNMRHHNPDDEASISAIYDEYKRLGGNSYIDMNYHEWSNKKRGSKKVASKRQIK